LLVGGFNPSEKYDFVSWDDDIPIHEMENKKSLKPQSILLGDHQPAIVDA